MMEGYRKNPPSTINHSKVLHLMDYELRKGKNIQTGETWDIQLPQSNVLQFILEDGSKISARPSGTEPKIKFYFSVNDHIDKTGDFEKMQLVLETRINGIISDMQLKS